MGGLRALLGLVCVVAIIASAVAWSSIQRAERAEKRTRDLEQIIADRDARIARLQAGAEDDPDVAGDDLKNRE